MPYLFLNSNRWFGSALCCRYLAVRFGKLQARVRQDRSEGIAEWQWALGLFTDGRFQVLGAWHEDGAATAQLIAEDLYDRGIERIKALVGDRSLTSACGRFHPRECRPTAEQFAECSAFGPRMQRAIRWTDTAALRVQDRVQRAVRKQAAFGDHAAAADFIAQAFQRAERDLLADYWGRSKPAPYGLAAAPAMLVRAG